MLINRMEILLIRHGESEGNVLKRVQTNLEPLTDKGKEKVSELRNKLEKENIEVVFSSDLLRCVQTTEILFQNKIPVFYKKELREKSNGDFEGKLVSEVDWMSVKGDFETKKSPGGESLRDVKCRAEKFLELLKNLKHNKIAVVSHATFLRVLLSILLHKKIEEVIMSIELPSCSVSRLEFNNGKFLIKEIQSTQRKQG